MAHVLKGSHIFKPTLLLGPERGRGNSKMQIDRFSCESGFFSEKVCYKVFCAKTVSGKVVRHSLACLI